MFDRTNDKCGRRVVAAAVVCALAIIIAGLATGMAGALRLRRETPPTQDNMAQYLLEEAAYSLKNSVSALRLCNETDTADDVGRTALVHAVRAETALECVNGDFADNREKEAFLNDISTVLHTYEPMEAVKLSDKLYECATRFYNSIASGGAFEYNGELIEHAPDAPSAEITEADITSGKELVTTALVGSTAEYVGAFDGHIEYYIERDGKSGYALVCDGKVYEFSFMRDENGGETDEETAKRLALDIAEKCGYGKLAVRWCELVGKSTAVLMCKEYDGALACDDYATAVVFGGEVVSFTAGHCDAVHENIPEPKKTEMQARSGAAGGENGVLVVRTVNGKERICYEYRVELDDGVHFVYVCAENGKQIQVN
ncbi:MAG: hypothetical protein OSJ83_07470 [Clostridia bacterium]|nr:hypothetical protein [Clostridia bacterium]